MVSISVAQLRAARGLVGWSQTQLAEASKVSRATIADFEIGKRTPYTRTIEEIQRALEGAGVVFLGLGQTSIGGEGVRLSNE
jgi:transcriptional regulator with XRE-family HTH domain